MAKQLVIFIAPPGAGKGTQADMLAEKSGFIHIETSKIIEEKFRDAEPGDPAMEEEKRRWLEGELVDAHKVARWLLDRVGKLAGEGKSLVLSASPRALFEVEVELPEFEELYGRDNIKIFYLTLSEEESVRRNSERRICEKNRHPIPRPEYDPRFKDIITCPWDGSPIITRALDKPEVIRERYKIYKAETEPVFNYFREKGYKIIEINGEQPIDKVFEDIMKIFLG